MSDSASVIERFQKMAEADPTNELGHFSLGRALAQAGRWDESAASFQRVIQLNPNMGRAYQLLGQALIELQRKSEAIEILTQGIHVAQAHGEPMPRKEMAAMLQALGAPVPAEPESMRQAVGEGQVVCRRCGKVNPKLAKPPMRGDFGREVFENICANCWRDAIGVGTKVINELRLPLDDPQAGKIWDQHIREFLNLTGNQPV
jgi:tetratricopeptide (TPR) repeat protein